MMVIVLFCALLFGIEEVRERTLTEEVAHAVAQIVLLIEGIIPRGVLYVSIQLEDIPDLQYSVFLDLTGRCLQMSLNSSVYPPHFWKLTMCHALSERSLLTPETLDTVLCLFRQIRKNSTEKTLD